MIELWEAQSKLDQQAPPPPSKAGKGAPVQKKPPAPSQKKVKPPTRTPEKKRELPPIKKKGRGKIWAGIIFIIIGIILVITLLGMSFLPFIGVVLILLGVYLLYKGVTAVDKVLTPVKITRGGKTRTRKVYKDKKTLNKGVIFLIVVFVFFALPIFLTILQFGNVTDQAYSIYNTGDGGCSILRDDIESAGYHTTAIISGYEELRKFRIRHKSGHCVYRRSGCVFHHRAVVGGLSMRTTSSPSQTGVCRSEVQS